VFLSQQTFGSKAAGVTSLGRDPFGAIDSALRVHLWMCPFPSRVLSGLGSETRSAGSFLREGRSGSGFGKV
jgi:hypothetical protein